MAIVISCLRSKILFCIVYRVIFYTLIYLVICYINKHKVPSAVRQCIIKKLLTNENFKTIQIWHWLNVLFGTDKLQRYQVCKSHKFKNGSEKCE